MYISSSPTFRPSFTIVCLNNPLLTTGSLRGLFRAANKLVERVKIEEPDQQEVLCQLAHTEIDEEQNSYLCDDARVALFHSLSHGYDCSVLDVQGEK